MCHKRDASHEANQTATKVEPSMVEETSETPQNRHVIWLDPDDPAGAHAAMMALLDAQIEATDLAPQECDGSSRDGET